MGSFTEQWKVFHSKPLEYQGPDTLVLDGELIQVEERTMLKETILPPGQFNSVIRQIKKASLDRVEMIQAATAKRMSELSKTTKPRKAVRGVPEGSDHFDAGSLVTWINGVQADDKAAVNQLIMIDATCHRRLDV